MVKFVNKIHKWNVTTLARLMIRTVNNKFDFNIALTGLRGTGKSTLAYQVARSIQRVPDRIKGTYVFNPQRDILYSPKDVLKAVNTRWRSIIFVDEAVAVSFNREFMSDHNKKLVKAMNMNRDHCNIILFCIPSFASLDTQMKGMIKMRIHTVKRGHGIVQTPMKTIYGRDGWDSQNNEKIEREWSERGSIKPRYNRLTTFRGVIKFKDLPHEHRKLYENIKVSKRNEIILEEAEKESAKDKTMQRSAVAQRLAHALEDGQITTRDEFNKMCIVFESDPTQMVRKVREYNRSRGIETKLNEFFAKNSESIPKEIVTQKVLNVSRKKKEVLQQSIEGRPVDIPDVLI